MSKISVVINTYNEQKNIVRCLESVKWADEIVVVDMYSTDKTKEIAKKYTKHIFLHEQTGYVEPARNFAIGKATGDWILIVDADEEISKSLALSLRKIADGDSEAAVVFLPRKNIIFEKWIQHSGWWPDNIIRFFRKGAVTWKDAIHSVPETRGTILTLTGEENAIVHHNYQSIGQFLYKSVQIYARQEAEELIKKGYRFNYSDAIRLPVKEFLSRYFAREGYKDGFHGLMLALLMAFYHFAIFTYIWEKKKFIDEGNIRVEDFEKDIAESGKEFKYWIHKSKIEEEKDILKKTILRIKRKLT